MADGEPDGYEIPFHSGPTERIFIGGVPRSIAICNATVAAAITLPLGIWYVGIPLGIIVHMIARYLCKRDPFFFENLRRHIRHPAQMRR